MLAAPAAYADTLTVNDAGNDGPGTLRDQVAAAVDGDVVEIAAGVDPLLTGAQIEIDDDITVRGQGPSDTTVSGDNNSRIFEIASGKSVAIEDLELTEGRGPLSAGGVAGSDGGAISVLSTASLSLTRVIVSESRAGHGSTSFGPTGFGSDGGDGGGISAGADSVVTIVDSVITANTAGDGGPGVANAFETTGGSGGDGGRGGGIFSAGTLEISSSLVAGNSSGTGGRGGNDTDGGAGGSGGDGGGIYGSDTTTLTNVTIYDNSTGAGGAGGDGAGGFNSGAGGRGGYGGGFFQQVGGSELIHGTVAANTAGVGGVDGSGIGDGMPGIHGHGGGVSLQGGTLLNTIVASNSGNPASQNCSSDGDLGGNIAFPDLGGCDAGFTVGDPMLDLAGPEPNGGPTETIAIAPDSAAADHVAASGSGCVAMDARGVARPRGGACDSGAFELELPPTCSDTTATTEFGTAVGITLGCTDDGPFTAHSIATNPANGTLSGLDPDAGTVTYTPNPGFSGSDSFTFSASNTGGSSALATARITVSPEEVDDPVELRLGKLKRNKRNGTAKLTVFFPGPGSLTLNGKGLKKTTKSPRAGDKTKLKIKPKGKAKRKLKRKGKRKFKVKVIYRPAEGDKQTKSKKVKLKYHKRKGKKGRRK